MSINIEELVKAVAVFCRKAGIEYSFEPEKKAFLARYTMEGKHFRFIISYEEDEIMTFFWADGIKADMGNNLELLKLINMVNWRIKSGRMAMDPNSGEIRFDNYLKVMEGCNLEEALEDMMVVSVITMEHYYSAILPLSLGFSSAEAEMEKLDAARRRAREAKAGEGSKAS